MNRKLVSLLIGLVSLLGLSWGEGPNVTDAMVTIGSTRWYSQEIAHEDLLKIAQKENKPILTVFSATWCGPCQQLKETAFKKDEFKSVADKIILQYIEQTTQKGQAYCQRFTVRGYPTMKIFSPEGDQLEEAGQPVRTPEGFSLWIDKVKSGDNIYTHRKNVKNHPDDLAARINLARSLFDVDVQEGFDHLDFIISRTDLSTTNPAIYQEAMELKTGRIDYLLSALQWKNKNRSNELPGVKTLAEYPALRKHMETVYESWAPDKFKYLLKKNWLYTFINWYATSEEYSKVIELFEKYGSAGETVHWDKIQNCFGDVLLAYLKLRQDNKMEKRLAEFRDHILSDGSLASDMNTSYAYLSAQQVLINHYLKQNQRRQAEKHLIQLMNDFQKANVNRHDQLLMYLYGSKEKLALPYFLPMAEAALMASTSKDRYSHYLIYGEILTAAGQKDKAKKLFIGGLEDPELIAGLPADQQALMKAQMIHGLAENEIFDPETLRVGEELLKKQRTVSTLSAVSMLKAGLDDAAGAIALLEEARSLESDAQKKADFEKRIADLKQKQK